MRSVVVACLSLLLCACAQRTGFFGPLDPVADEYARNQIVCLPTGIGNLAGLPGFILLLPFGYLEERRGRYDDEIGPVRVVQMTAFGVLVLGPAALGGFAVGTPFLPLSYLADEDPCHFS